MNHVEEKLQMFESELARHGAGGFEGCSDDEIKQISLSLHNPLPEAYRLFLKTMGRRTGRFFGGSTLTYPRLLDLREVAEEIVAESIQEGLIETQLPDDAIVFLMHQGYQFWFIKASEGDDPPVYYYLESDITFRKSSDSFTSYLMTVATDWRAYGG